MFYWRDVYSSARQTFFVLVICFPVIIFFSSVPYPDSRLDLIYVRGLPDSWQHATEVKEQSMGTTEQNAIKIRDQSGNAGYSSEVR